MKRKVGLIGDLIIDKFVNLKSLRLSPEAPVPVVKRTETFETLGGAGNVALSLINLGLESTYYFAFNNSIQTDTHKIISNLLNNLDINKKKIFTDIKDINPIKIRYYVDDRQIMREDKEFNNKDKISIITESLIDEIVSNNNILIVSDYQKGLFNTSSLKYLINLCNNYRKPLFIDTKNKNIESIKNAFCLKINKFEFNSIFKEFKLQDEDSLGVIENKIKKAKIFSKIKNLVVTLGSKGSISITNYQTFYCPAFKVDVNDITGAGDAFISALLYSFIQNASDSQNEIFSRELDMENIKFANYAASSVVSKRGTVPIDVNFGITYKSKLNNKKTIGFTNGCFDILHIGHLHLLEEAKKCCDYLIVGLNSDNSITKLKGESRPVNNLFSRLKLLKSIKYVDEVVVFEEETPENLIRKIKPDLLIKGSDYSEEEIIGANFVKSYGGKILRIDLLDNISSTSFINKIRNS